MPPPSSRTPIPTVPVPPNGGLRPSVMRTRASALLPEFPCLAPQRIGSLAGPCENPLTYKAIAEATWDEDNRKIEGASQMGCRMIEVHPTLTVMGRKHPVSQIGSRALP